MMGIRAATPAGTDPATAASALLGTGSPVAWDASGRLGEALVSRIAAHLSDLTGSVAHQTVHALCARADYRLIAQYLFALRAGDREVATLCERFPTGAEHELGRLRFALALAWFQRARLDGTGGSPAHPAEFRMVGHPAEVLADNPDRTTVYLTDVSYHAALRELVEHVDGEVGQFIEHQLDVPGPNARVREGTVKTWFLPDGTQVASKRENPRKPGRYEREQLAYAAVADRLHHRDDLDHRDELDHHAGLDLGTGPDGRQVRLAVVSVIAWIRDPGTGHLYSISAWGAGTPMEQLLLAPASETQRRTWLAGFRSVLDALLDRGVWWGDMSPRNVLVQPMGGLDLYRVLDFEKTTVTDQPVTPADRVAFCRGSIGVEELGVLCPLREVIGCLHGYFAPEEWDLSATTAVPFPVRPELAAILRGRGTGTPTLGELNRQDRQVLEVRLPDTEPGTGRRRYPGLVNFRVEHYLSCAGRDDAAEYDRLTTEVLIAAKRSGEFELVLTRLTEAVDELEREFVLAEFDALLRGPDRAPARIPDAEVSSLVATIDDFAARAVLPRSANLTPEDPR